MKSEQPSAAPEQFALSALMERYLQSQAKAGAQGLALPDLQGEVVPYDAGPVQVVEPQVAWNDAVAAITLTDAEVTVADLPACPEWGNLVMAQDPAFSVAFCTANFPQMVRNFIPVLQGGELTPTPLTMSRSVSSQAYLKWAEENAEKAWPRPLLSIGALRLAQEFEKAEGLLDRKKDDVPQQWQSVWHNERAALAWHQGKHDQAHALWQAQEPTTLVRFNRGMASLFLGKHAQAHAELTQAAAEIPETSAWHHLAQLYLTLAAMRA